VPILLITVVLLFPAFGVADLAFDLIAVAIVFPFCVYAGACASMDPRSGRVYATLEILSYPIYLLHTPASKIVASYLDLSATPYSALVGASFAVLLALACLALDRLYDRPVRKLLTGLAARFRVTGRAGQPG